MKNSAAVSEDPVRLSLQEALDLCTEALLGAGASLPAAQALARATVDAEAAGNRGVGFAHLPDYLGALREGRIDGRAEPVLARPLPAVTVCDARGGTAHLGFALALPDLARTAEEFGCAVFAQRNAYTCGELGHFALALAEEGLVALAATNGPALMAAGQSRKPVFCTNPLAFAAPVEDGPALLIDQSSSATAFVNVRAAAERGEALPPGWAIDKDGRPTTNAKAAIDGALLAFGGARGANIALMVEVLAGGVAGGNWSLDAPSISEGSESPGSGLFVLALSPALLGDGFPGRLAAQVERLQSFGVYVPGHGRGRMREAAEQDGLSASRAVVERIRGFLSPA